ncbi:hypothetical protein RHMOL_Rhmol01G0155200 [Rhododendron molle]|uniref:Uncharacterized protein n=1 Tax=Rhododendron molle TaxID=49168 RepID=A0ACC0Q3D6_RHOML|nr:hypothetical protein RHMOL_Rhmol01G0155200 [Rhododendron molle]
MAARGLIIEEPVPTAGQWRMAPYFQSVEDCFWTLVGAYTPEGPSTSNPTSFTAPADLGSAELVNSSSVMRLRLKRRDFPYLKCHFGA